MPGTRLSIKAFGAGLLFLFSAISSHATSYDISLNNTSSGGFLPNVFHFGGGTIIADITGASGTYDSTTGSLNLLLTVAGTGPLAGAGPETLSFAGSGFNFPSPPAASNNTLSTPATANISLLNMGLPVVSGVFNFAPQKECCGPDGPNTLNDVGGGLLLLTLWGGTANIDLGEHGTTSLGIDLRLDLTPVPIPGAVLLFGTALAGLIGLRRRQSRFAQPSATA